jgi:pyrroloquinoline quinone biosynthesis protein D
MNPLTDECRPKLARGVRLRADPIDGEPVLLYPEGFLKLDDSAHDILTRCNGQSTVANIITELASEYEASPEELRSDVVEYLTQLRQEMLVIIA